MRQDPNDERQDIPLSDVDEDGVAGESPQQPLVRVRYGLGKELNLYPDAIVVELHEQREETRYELDTIKRLILMPGEYVPSKWVVMLDLDDETTVVAVDGMTNHRDFRKLVAQLVETRPDIELDPPDMDEQIAQALDIKKRNLFGCYGFVAACAILLYIIYLVVAFIGAHGPH
ncbi:MAG TPA: hypothetical protein VKQ30_08070 [Ktedonobacterales bacterium]|nr:hypothetical protein [Ktedonobacterales bacterium]